MYLRMRRICRRSRLSLIRASEGVREVAMILAQALSAAIQPSRYSSEIITVARCFVEAVLNLAHTIRGGRGW